MTENYASKMNEISSKAIRDWWQSLSKEELCKYLIDQPQVSADDIRKMLANMNCTIAFGMSFNTATSTTDTDFYLTDK